MPFKGGFYQMRYGSLRIVGWFVQAVGYLLVVVGAVLIIVALFGGVTGSDRSVPPSVFAVAGLFLVAMGIIVIAQAQLVEVWIDTEENTREGTELLRQIAGYLSNGTSHSSLPGTAAAPDPIVAALAGYQASQSPPPRTAGTPDSARPPRRPPNLSADGLLADGERSEREDTPASMREAVRVYRLFLRRYPDDTRHREVERKATRLSIMLGIPDDDTDET
jgi:hypothetical protein